MIIKGKPCIVFDIECLRNVFTCTCKNTETSKIITFEISHRHFDLFDMCKYFLTEDAYFVGYNNIHYDNPIINYCIEYSHICSNLDYRQWTESIFNLSKIIISDNDAEKEKWKKYKYSTQFLTIDLLTMLYSTALRVGLKAMQVTMHYKNVEEFVIDWNKDITDSEIETLILYNINDVESTEELLNRCKKQLELRVEVEKEYNIDCLSLDNVNLGMEILKTQYMKKTGINWWDLKDLRSPADTVDLEKVIFPWIKFRSKTLQDVLTDMKCQHSVSPGRKGYINTFAFAGMSVTVGVGGIHGDCGTCIIKPNDDEVLLEPDVASLYPSMIIEHELYPPHLGHEFLDVYSGIRTERLDAKHSGAKAKNIMLKYSLNGLSGNLQNEFSWCYSPFTVMQIRINGQLLLLMLAERLIEIGCKLKQINTDGIVVLMKKNRMDEYKQICSEWEKETKLTLETEEFKSLYQLAINDYFGVAPDGEIKKKGIFLTEVELGKGLTPKIIPEAVIKFFVDGVPVEDTIKNCTDIRKFLMSEKTGKQWTVEYNEQVQQRTNRFYVSNNGYYLWKWKIDDRKDIKKGGKTVPNPNYGGKLYQNMLVGYGVTLLNRFDDNMQHDINYQYYIIQAKKIIEQLKPRQLSLFDFD